MGALQEKCWRGRQVGRATANREQLTLRNVDDKETEKKASIAIQSHPKNMFFSLICKKKTNKKPQKS